MRYAVPYFQIYCVGKEFGSLSNPERLFLFSNTYLLYNATETFKIVRRKSKKAVLPTLIYVRCMTLVYIAHLTRLCDMYGAVNSTLSSLALDSSRGLLYFTDPGRGSLGVLSTDGFGGSPNLLITGANEKPTAVAVDSANRHLCSLLLNMYY